MMLSSQLPLRNTLRRTVFQFRQYTYATRQTSNIFSASCGAAGTAALCCRLSCRWRACCAAPHHPGQPEYLRKRRSVRRVQEAPRHELRYTGEPAWTLPSMTGSARGLHVWSSAGAAEMGASPERLGCDKHTTSGTFPAEVEYPGYQCPPRGSAPGSSAAGWMPAAQPHPTP